MERNFKGKTEMGRDSDIFTGIENLLESVGDFGGERGRVDETLGK